MCQLAPHFVQVKWSVKREKKVGQVNRELFVWKMILNYIEIFCFILVPNHLLLEMLILLLLRQKFLQFELNWILPELDGRHLNLGSSILNLQNKLLMWLFRSETLNNWTVLCWVEYSWNSIVIICLWQQPRWCWLLMFVDEMAGCVWPGMAG